jgi:hypothetical protein
VDVLVVVDDLSSAERRDVIDAAYELNASGEDWMGLSALACSTEEARSLRSRGRRLWTEIAQEGIAL